MTVKDVLAYGIIGIIIIVLIPSPFINSSEEFLPQFLQIWTALLLCGAIIFTVGWAFQHVFGSL